MENTTNETHLCDGYEVRTIIKNYEVKKTHETHLCNGYEVRTIIKNYGREPHNATSILFNIEDLSEAMGWDCRFREFLLSLYKLDDSDDEKGYMEEEVIEMYMDKYFNSTFNNYHNWLMTEIYHKSPDDFISNDEMKEIQKENLKELALKAVIAIVIVVGIALIL